MLILYVINFLNGQLLLNNIIEITEIFRNFILLRIYSIIFISIILLHVEINKHFMYIVGNIYDIIKNIFIL